MKDLNSKTTGKTLSLNITPHLGTPRREENTLKRKIGIKKNDLWNFK